jgi:hypothetical protein
MTRTLKVSLHESGRWRVGWVKPDPKNPLADRAIWKWERPAEFAPGLTNSISVLVSPTHDDPIPSPPSPTDHDSLIHWFPQARSGYKLVFRIVFCRPRSVKVRDAVVVGSLKKADGETAFLLLEETLITPVQTRKIREVLENLKLNTSEEQEPNFRGARAILVVSPDYPGPLDQPIVYDIGLALKNLR